MSIKSLPANTKHVTYAVLANGNKLFIPHDTEFEAVTDAKRLSKLGSVKKVAWTGCMVSWKWQIVK